jgi:hypothetical protein
MDIAKNYVIAEGASGLKDVLIELLQHSQIDPSFAQQEHHVLYKLGNQKTMIRVDTEQAPFKFWCYDLLGRALTLPVKDTLADFLWENWGEKNNHFQDKMDLNK